MKKGIVLGIVILVIGMSFTGSSYSLSMNKSQMFTFEGNTLYVGGSGEGNYTTIQSAIDDANSGDTVFVYNGTYYESLLIDKSNLSIIGENINSTIIDSNDLPDGLYITKDNFTISNFTIKNGYQDGIVIRSSSNCEINNCIIHNFSYHGIVLYSYTNGETNNNSIINCEIINNGKNGIRLYGRYNTLSYNKIIDSKILYNSEVGIEFDGDFQKNYNIISGNNISNNEFGVYLQSSNENTVESNIITFNPKGGLELNEFCNYNNILKNDITSNARGLNIMWYSNNNTIFTNKFKSNHVRQIYIYYHSNFNTISNNYIRDSDRGIDLRYFCDNNTIIFNNFWNNNLGLYLLYNSSNNKIVRNDIFLSDYLGIQIHHSTNNNLIYHNNFFGNTQNAHDECDNKWDDGYPSGGNYWDDYPYDDENHGPNQDLPGHDRIGDVPYDLPCEHATDYYPLMIPDDWKNRVPKNITIDGPTHGKAGESYTYTTSAKDPDGDLIYYLFDWGDGSHSDYLGPYISGTNVSASHSWSMGTYAIEVIAMDTREQQGFSDPYPITMPRNKAVTNSILLSLLERFLLLQRILDVWRDSIE